MASLATVAGARAQPAGIAEPRIVLRCGPDELRLTLQRGVAVQVAIAPTITRVPQTRAWFRGVINQRGHLHPLFDLAAWCGASPLPLRIDRIVVAEAGEDSAALLWPRASGRRDAAAAGGRSRRGRAGHAAALRRARVLE